MQFDCDGNTLTPHDPAAVRYMARRAGKLCDLREHGHSLRQHGLAFKFVDYLWTTYYAERFPIKDAFRYWLSICVGYYEMGMRLLPTGEWAEVLIARSWSMEHATQKDFDAMVRAIDAWAEKNHGVTIEAWAANSPEQEAAGVKRYRLKFEKP